MNDDNFESAWRTTPLAAYESQGDWLKRERRRTAARWLWAAVIVVAWAWAVML